MLRVGVWNLIDSLMNTVDFEMGKIQGPEM